MRRFSVERGGEQLAKLCLGDAELGFCYYDGLR